MALEIERKYRVVSDAWRALAHASERLEQGYLAGSAALYTGATKCIVRVRASDTRGWITIKSDEDGIVRQEFEFDIPVDDARALLHGLADGVVTKTRHHVIVDGTHFEVDEFDGPNAGLVVAEVELPSEHAPHAHPSWLGREVSTDTKYLNANLIGRPFSVWTAAEQAA